MTLLGVSAANTSGAVVNRSCGSGYIIACEEAKITTDSGSTFVYGADRRHYEDMGDTFPPNGDNVFGRVSGHATADFENDRLPVISTKLTALTWAQTGALTSGANYNAIVTKGNQIKSWQDSHIGQGRWGCTFAWTFHHEPNDSDDVAAQGGTPTAAAANWRAAITKIVAIWTGLGVRFWQGDNNGNTTQEGIILSVNLVSGETSGGHQDEWDIWWPSGDAWMNANMVWAAADGYNNGDVMKPFSFIFQTYKSWSDAKRTSQAAAGRAFLAGIWETGCQAVSFYTTSHATWTATGLAVTKANWFLNMADYIEASWPLLFAVCYWDSVVVMIWTLDTTQADWNGWVAISDHAAWQLDPAGFTQIDMAGWAALV